MSILLTFLTLFIIFGMPLGAVLILTWYIYYFLRNISLFSSFVNEMLFLHNIALIGNSFSPPPHPTPCSIPQSRANAWWHHPPGNGKWHHHEIVMNLRNYDFSLHPVWYNERKWRWIKQVIKNSIQLCPSFIPLRKSSDWNVYLTAHI